MTKETFNKTASHPLQSWEWGEFRKRAGNELVRFPFGQITLHKIPFTPFKVAAFEKGPAPTSRMLEELKKLAREENLVFIKLEPNVLKNERLIGLLKKNGATRGKRLFTPTTFWIDLTASEEELLKSFHSKTRYNIRLAQKNGVEVKENNSDKAFEKYISLTRETAQRQNFYAHKEKYHRLMWTVLHKEMVKEGKAPIARLLTATYKKEIITAWIVFTWHDFLYYPYGASTDKYKNVMANNLIMWEAIRFGKRLGLSTFDLWGREEGKGFTRFKEGYNPKVVEFLGTWDLVTSHLYYPYRLSELARWLILRAKSKIVKPTF
ncbi:peptidoglycan bridge formation glycyltransferase FemA/FemB family protein [Candidatus Woesebacteria bacterium]|nr:peptidoglycan bridge formation glycyltransferase FemA/FemB family protein [Candidatus Woesebacteria bacterium]